VPCGPPADSPVSRTDKPARAHLARIRAESDDMRGGHAGCQGGSRRQIIGREDGDRASDTLRLPWICGGTGVMSGSGTRSDPRFGRRRFRLSCYRLVGRVPVLAPPALPV
jgi:hypothetical protein